MKITMTAISLKEEKDVAAVVLTEVILSEAATAEEMIIAGKIQVGVDLVADQEVIAAEDVNIISSVIKTGMLNSIPVFILIRSVI